MSRVVDTRIAEMRFDNKDFEANVAQSMSTLDKLKQALNFGDAGKSFDNITKAAAGLNIGGIGDAIDTVKEKFSALEVAGVTALVNLTNRAVDAGMQMVKSLTIDQVTAGFDKYAEKTKAVQTIMAATRSEFSDEAEQMEYVNEQLDKLNWFTDETSYNLVDMTSNIGKFTNAGIKLDDAVTSMQGIATWAGISGANATEASRAMYNLSQALASGYVRLIDWKSIENANMATLEFKEAAIEAGLAMGTLVKYTDEESGLTKIMSANGEEFDITAQNFSASLTKGAWLTSDVLNSVLDRYGGFTNKLNEAYNATGLETSKLLRYTEDYEKGLLDLDKVMKETGLDADEVTRIFKELADPTYELGRRAFKASQETKTFAEVIDYTKDAVSSGWMNTFEIIFGDYEEAKAMWTDLAEVFYEIFVASGEARNEMLEAWKELGGRTSMLEAVSNAYSAVVKVIETLKDAFHDIFPVKETEEKGQALFDLTERVREFTEKLIMSDETADKLKKAVTPLFQVFRNIVDTVRAAGAEIKDTLFPAFKLIFDSAKKVLGPLGRVIKTFSDFTKFVLGPLTVLPDNIWSGFTRGVPGVITGIQDIADKAAIWLTNFNETLLTSEKLQGALQKIRKIFAFIEQFISSFLNLSDTFEVFQIAGGGISGVLAVIHSKLADLWILVKNVVHAVTGIDISDGIIGQIADGISGAIDKITEAFKNFSKVDTSGVDKVRNAAEQKLGPVASMLEGFKKILSGIWEFLKKLAPLFSAVGSAIGSAFNKLGTAIGDSVSNMNADTILDLANGGILVAIGIGIKKLVDWLNSLKDGIGIIDKLKEAIEPITGVLDSARGALEAWQQNLKAGTLLKLAGAIAIITASVLVLSEIDPEKLASALTAITIEFGELLGSMKGLSKITTSIDIKKLTATGLAMIELGIAVLILSSAVKNLAELEWDDMIEGLAGVGAICFELSITLKNLNLDGLSFTKGVGLMLLAGAVSMLASAVKSLSKLSWGEMIEGLAGVGVLCFELSQTLNKTDFNGMSISKSAGILVLAISLKVLASAVKQMSDLDWGEMIKGLLGVGALLLELNLFMNSTNLSGMSISKSVGILIFAAAMKVLASAVKQMTALGWGELIKGLVGVGAIMLEIIGFMGLLDAIGASSGKMIAASAAMVIMGVALGMMADVLKKFGGMSVEEICKSLIMLAGTLVIFAGGMALLEGALSGAAALLVIALALQVLNPVLQSFASMEWMEILKSLAELAGIFLILGAAGAILGPLTPIILALAAAVVLLGIGVTGIGAGVALLGAGLSAVALAGAEAVKTLALLVADLIKMIPDFIAAIGQGILELIKFIGDSALEIAQAVIKVGHAILLTLVELIPDLVATVVTIIDEILKTLVEHGPSIVSSVVDLLMMLLAALGEKLPDLIGFVIDAILGILAAIAERVPEFIQAGIDIIIALIDGLGQGLVDNAPRLRDAILGLLGNILKAILAFFGIHSPSTVFADIGEKLILGLIQGIGGMITGAVNAIKKLASALVQGIKSKFEEFKQKGKELIDKIKTGISEKAEALKTKMSETVSAVKQKISDKVEEFKEKGKELITKIRDGMSDEQKEAFDKMVETVKGIKDKIEEKLGWFSEKGGEIMDVMKSGMSAKEKLDALKKIMSDSLQEIKDGAGKKIEEFVNIGKEIVDGIKKGISDAWTGFTTWTSEKFEGLVQGWNDFWGINSPSKLTAEMGGYIAVGFANGIVDNTKKVVNAADNMMKKTMKVFDKQAMKLSPAKAINYAAKDALNTMKKAAAEATSIKTASKLITKSASVMKKTQSGDAFESLKNIGTKIKKMAQDMWDIPIMPTLAEDKFLVGVGNAVEAANNMELNPTITPVVDTNSLNSQVEANVNEVYEVKLADIAQINASGFDGIQNELRILNSDVEKYISDLREDVISVKKDLVKLKIVMDTGALVGVLTKPIDDALGVASRLMQRGVT